MKTAFASVKYWQRGLLALLLVALSACQHTAEVSSSAASNSTHASAATHTEIHTEIFTSDNDRRAFRYLELPNHLRVLLISAPNTDKASAALDVNVGSRQDPLDRQGLAHFLEHMLFLGTDKYPDADAYQEFISAHSGNHNAFTAFEHTNYFFDIDPAYLEPALDRFSRFFVAPLFSANYVEREKHAVDAEYRSNIREDQRRTLDVMREVINPENPLSKFSVGNLETLADRNNTAARSNRSVRDDLLAFYRENYSSNLMTLVVIGREPLDQLQAMVTTRFSEVPDHQRHIEPIAAPLLKPNTAPLLVQIQSVQQQFVLSLAWPLPDQHDDYRGKSIEYIGNILGHEGAGSLLSTLKQRGWASALSAGQGLDYKGGAQFNLTLELTPAGKKHSDEIIALVYQTIALIREGGIQDWLYREQQNVAAQRFRFRDNAPPISESSHLAGNLQEYPAAEVIRGDYLMEQFEPQRIAELLDLLQPQNMLAMLSAPQEKTDHSGSHDRHSQYYAVPYRAQTATPQQIQRWLTKDMHADIHLPAPNEFIAAQLPLKPIVDKTATKPTLLPTANGLNAWTLQDSTFRVPKATITLEVQSPLANDTPAHAAAMELWTRTLRENLNEFSYPAALAGLNYDIGHAGRGIMIRIDGFDAKQSVLLTRVLDTLQQSQISPTIFTRVREDYCRELRDNIKRPPYELLRDDLGDVLVRNSWTDTDLLQHCETISAQETARFAQQFLSRIHVDMLVYGNVVNADSQQLSDLVTAKLLAHAQPIAAPPVQIMQLDNHDYRRTLNAPHPDSALLWYRQAGDNSKTTRVALGVSTQMISSDFYTRLRTEQQFGYIVAAFPMPLRDVPGLVFLAQSTNAGPAKLDAAYREFLAHWAQRDEEQLRQLFALHRAALAQRLSEAPKNFAESGERLWQDVAAGYRNFDSREQLVNAVNALTFEQWLPLFRRDVLTVDGHSIALSTSGKFGDNALRRGTAITHLEQFKSRQNYYQFE